MLHLDSSIKVRESYLASMTLIRALTKPGELAWNITREVGASVLAYELYPLAILGNSLPALPIFWTKSQSHRRPILFIHGIFHNKSAFFYLKQKLAAKGWHHFREMDLLTSVYTIPRLAERVRCEVDKLREEYQTDQIDIVAHSMGGIIARYYLQKLNGDGVAKNLITLGTPHQGTQWSKYSLLPHIRELQPASNLLKELNGLEPPQKTRAVSVSGTLDIMMSPATAPQWSGVRHIELKNVGHAGLLFSKRVFQIVACHLDD
ncbi:MAG: alpha/beta fold hydrolase [Proteobacteria bacterium]|nr:alpha/beta fold hydrolase [Pseudomonadota bacterium]